MKERLYRAFWDDGDNSGEFEFYSKYKAGSKSNLEDAYREYRLSYGRTRRNSIKITSIYLI